MKATYLPVLLALAVAVASCTEPVSSIETTGQEDQTALIAKKPAGTDYVPGTDITEQLRNDLNAGHDVAIPAGHFYISESIIVHEYAGTIKGAGRDETFLEAAQGFRASADPFPVFPPDKRFTEMLSIYHATGDVTMKAMTVMVTDDAPAEVHDNMWFPGVTTIDNVLFVGSVSLNAQVDEVTATFKDLAIIGEESDDPGAVNGKNMIYPITATGWYIPGYSADKPVNVVVKDCYIENAGFAGISYVVLPGGSGEIKGNEVLNSLQGVYLTEMAWAEVKGNAFAGIATAPIVKDVGVVDHCFKGNWLDGSKLPNDCQ
jgi:hypothetical protein